MRAAVRIGIIAVLSLAVALKTAQTLTQMARDRQVAESIESEAPAERAGSADAGASHNIRFSDVARGAGLSYHWKVPGPRPLNILQSIGNGCAFLDYNNDGNLDILLVGEHLALYRGDGKGRFSDVTRAMGLNRFDGHFLGCAVGDYDNDGYDDIYITGYHTGLLLHNEHGTGFKDVTREMGLKPQPWGTSAAFVDLDGDGYLDLYVCNYVQFDGASKQLCPEQGVVAACPPSTYPALRGVLYHNAGARRFEDVTASYGLGSATGSALGVAAAPLGSGIATCGLAIADDGTGDDLFVRPQASTWVNKSAQYGTRTDAAGNKHAGMGIDWGDYDNHGKLDLFVTAFSNETKCLYHNEGETFKEVSEQAGITTALIPFVSFGCKFLDASNDGWLDLLIANGHVYSNIDDAHRGLTYRQPLRFLYNLGASGKTGQFANLRHGTGLEKLPAIVGRGLATGDFDNDGRMDALAVDSEGYPLLLHNESRDTGHWLGLKLTGAGPSNRDAYGATVVVKAGARSLMRVCHADGSYLSSSDRRVHIGLGSARRIDSVTVMWPDRRKETLHNLRVDRYIAWTEGQPGAAAGGTR